MNSAANAIAGTPIDPGLPQVVRISAGRRLRLLEIRDLWAYRELLYFLAWRDVKVRYKQTALGAGWAILQPVASMLVFTLFFGKLARIPTDGIPYPIFVYAGLLPWTFFANAVTASGDSLVANSNLITKVYFPRMLIPGAAVAAGLVDFAISAVVFLVMMPLYAVGIQWRMLMAAPLLALTVLVALAFGMWIAALNVKYRDVRYAVPFMIQLWMFVTPVIYPVTIVPQPMALVALRKSHVRHHPGVSQRPVGPRFRLDRIAPGQCDHAGDVNLLRLCVPADGAKLCRLRIAGLEVTVSSGENCW